jgi:CubicO group peptidase (beta-lactamase class C family)
MITQAAGAPFFSLLKSFSRAGAQGDASLESVIAGLTKSIPDWMSKRGVPGLSVALIKDARVAWTQGFGVKSAVTKDPAPADTVFEAASLSKPCFAYAALKLCDMGKLNLDAPLNEYLPTPLVPNEPRLKMITARRVLSHSSGLPHGRPEGTPISLRFTPGERFAYSATGFQYLQMVVERAAGQQLTDFMKSRVLDPFGMRSSNFGWVKRFETESAQGHWKDGRTGLSGNGKYLAATAEEKEKMNRDFPEYNYPSASAGLYTTAGDYARFMIEVMAPTREDPFRLSEAMVAEMLKPQIKVKDSISWGLGWGIERTVSGDAFWHWGDWGIFRNFALASKKEAAGVVVLTNSFNGPKVYQEIVPAAIGGVHPSLAWVQSYRP